MFSTSCGRCRRTVFTAWNTSTSPCLMTCSMQALAAQYTPARLRPSLQQYSNCSFPYVERNSINLKSISAMIKYLKTGF